MTSLVNAIQSVELKTALQPLTISGAYGEIFDADTDSLKLSSWQTPLGCRLYDLALENCPISLAYVAVNKADNKKAAEILEKYGRAEFNRHWLEYRNVSLPEVETERRRFF